MAINKVICANVCLSMVCVLGILGAIALAALSIVDALDSDLSKLGVAFPEGFCKDTYLSERRPFSVNYKVVDGVNHTATTYKICAEMLPGHLEGYNGTFCLYPPIPRDSEGNVIPSAMNFHCGFDLAVMFERFGFSAGFILGSVFVLLWIVLTRKKIEKNSVKWVGRVFGGIHTIWTILSVAAGFYLMIRDAHRVQASNDYCETFRQTYCNPAGFGEPIVGCTCNNMNYVGLPLLEAILIVIYTFSVISTIFRWFADYRATKEGYTDLDAAVADLTRNQ